MALFIGRLEETKGIDVLLAVARRVSTAIEIVIVGEGPLQAQVENAHRNGIVRYLGRRGWTEIAGLMDHACALLVPSLWEENCPMVVLEAGARGCPVVASDRGGLTELVHHGRDGLLFPAGDANALAELLLGLARTRGCRSSSGVSAISEPRSITLLALPRLAHARLSVVCGPRSNLNDPTDRSDSAGNALHNSTNSGTVVLRDPLDALSAFVVSFCESAVRADRSVDRALNDW